MPSGDQTGSVSAPGPVTSGRTDEVARSITEMSARLPKLSSGFGVWTNAMRRPSGDQANAPTWPVTGRAAGAGTATHRVAAVSAPRDAAAAGAGAHGAARATSAPMSAATTQRRASRKSSFSTAKSPNALRLATRSSPSGPAAVNAMRDPSGDQAKSVMPPFTLVRRRASPPAARMMWSCRPSPRSAMKPSHRLSGDQRGVVLLSFSVKVSWIGSAPVRASQISVS